MIYERLRVFVSSAMTELAPERAAIKEALEALHVDAWVFEEDAGARPTTPRETYLRELENADLYIGVFWKDLGEYTLDEFEHARRANKDCLLYEKRTDLASRDARLHEFLTRVGGVESGLSINWFETPEELQAAVKRDASRWQADIVRASREQSTRRNLAPVSEPDRAALMALRQSVRRFWIGGVLEKSLHDLQVMDLGKQTSPDSVEQPWEAVLELPGGGSDVVSPGKEIVDVFDDVDQSLLILGQPGAGKTTSLLELTRALIVRCERNPDEPVPVVFNLSSWSNTGLPLVDWLVLELYEKYRMLKRVSLDWLENNRIILLLDGLDEVAMDQRADCAAAINSLIQSVGVPGIVVCSRLTDYRALPVKLKLNGAISLQPLTREQISSYVQQGGSKLASLSTVLEADPVLLDQAHSPLMLSIMALAYRDLPVTALVGEGLDTVEGRREHLFNSYIRRMLDRRGKKDRLFGDDVTVSRLGWLADRMKRHSKSVFLVEDLQPSWLGTAAATRVHVFGVAVLLGLVIGSVAGVTWTIVGSMDFYGGSSAMYTPFSEWLIVPPLWLVGVTLVEGLRADAADRGSARRILSDIGISVAVWVLAWVIVAVSSGWPMEELALRSLRPVIGGVWVLGMIGTMGVRYSVVRDIRSVEALGWLWQGARRGGAWGVLGGFSLWLASMFAWGVLGVQQMDWDWGQLDDALAGWWWQWLVAYVIIGLVVGAVFGGLRPRQVEARAEPNEGMKLTLRSAVFAGSVGGMIIGGGIYVAIMLVLNRSSWLNLSTHEFIDIDIKAGPTAAVGAIAGLAAALWYGGFEVLKHYCLRFTLYVRGEVPRNLTVFLDHAAGCVFLQKVGGGYIFIHRLLLEHFASQVGLPEEPGMGESTGPTVEEAH